MTIGNNGSGEHNQFNSEGPAKYTRNCTPAVITGCSSTMQYCKALLAPVQSVNILNLPQEVLEKIFSYLSFKNICQLRLVSNFFAPPLTFMIELFSYAKKVCMLCYIPSMCSIIFEYIHQVF